MKGKVELRFCLANIARLRGRVESPSKELSKQLREILTETIAEVLNGNTLAIRAKFIEKIQRLNLKYKTPEHEKQVNNLLGSIFDSVFATTVEALNEICGTEGDEDEEKADEIPADEAPVGDGMPPETEKPSKKSKTKEAPAEEVPAAVPGDDFD